MLGLLQTDIQIAIPARAEPILVRPRLGGEAAVAGRVELEADDVDALKKFKEKYKLNFVLLADPGLDAINAYGTKMPVMGMSKRWTFIIGPDLKIRSIDKDVDPVLDAKRVAEMLKELQKRT